MCPVLSCILIFIPIVLKELFQNPPITFEAQWPFPLLSPFVDFTVAFDVSLSVFCDTKMSWFSHHSSLTTTSQSSLISMGCSPCAGLYLIFSLFTRSSFASWAASPLFDTVLGPTQMQACISNCFICLPKKPSNPSNISFWNRADLPLRCSP